MAFLKMFSLYFMSSEHQSEIIATEKSIAHPIEPYVQLEVTNEYWKGSENIYSVSLK